MQDRAPDDGQFCEHVEMPIEDGTPVALKKHCMATVVKISSHLWSYSLDADRCGLGLRPGSRPSDGFETLASPRKIQPLSEASSSRSVGQSAGPGFCGNAGHSAP